MLPHKILEPGARLKVYNSICVTNDECRKRLEEARVIRQYPHHTLVENRLGTRWSVTNAELYCMEMGKITKMQLFGANGREVAFEKKRKAGHG